MSATHAERSAWSGCDGSASASMISSYPGKPRESSSGPSRPPPISRAGGLSSSAGRREGWSTANFRKSCSGSQANVYCLATGKKGITYGYIWPSALEVWVNLGWLCRNRRAREPRSIRCPAVL
jgi:hypothetical protein